jgi:hypothetical protein
MCYSFSVARIAQILFWVGVASGLLGIYVWVSPIGWPLHFQALEVHLWLGFVVLAVSSPALAWHLRRSRSRLVPSLLVPAAVLAVIALTIPGRPEYPALGPIGWAAATTSAQLVLTALVMRLMDGEGTSVPTSTSGIVLTVALLYGLHAGVFGWGLRGDERWGPMVAHSILGLGAALLMLAHLPAVRAALPKRGAPALLIIALVLLGWRWHATYPHDLVMKDFASPLEFTAKAGRPPARDWNTASASMPQTREQRPHPVGTPLDAAAIGDSMGCGAAGCHEAITRQWAGSSHRYSKDNRFYRKVVALLVKERGVDEAAWCATCHDPVSVLTDSVREDYADGDPPPGDGVTCVVCHATKASPFDPALDPGEDSDDDDDGEDSDEDSDKSSSRKAEDTPHYVPPEYPVLSVQEPVQYPGTGEERNRRIRLDPRLHRQSLVANFRINDPSLGCAPCHQLVVGEDVGAAVEAVVQSPFEGRVELRGFGDEVPVPGETGYRGSDLACTDCHMPTLTKIRDFEQPVYDHFIDGINLDLALYVTGDVDPESLALVRRHTAASLAGELTIDAFDPDELEYAIPAATTQAIQEPRVLGLTVEATRGLGGLRLSTTTTNHRAGHHFPSGPFDLNEIWQEVLVTDGAGRTLFHRGALDDDRRVDPEAHRLGAVELGRDGRRLAHHRLWDLAEVVDKRQVPMGASVTDTYEIPLPAASGPLTVEVWWRFRRANQDFVDWVFDDDGTTFPVHELAAARVEVAAG